MNHLPTLKALGIALMLWTTSFMAQAGEGHDHGDEAPSAAGPALPRFAATSELFELVGVLDGKRLTLYLDRATDNSPVKDAKLELELAGAKVKVEPHGEGEFEVMLAEAPKEGVIAVTATVVAGSDSDLLAGELDIHVDEPAASVAATGFDWKTYGGWGVAALLGVVAVVLGLTRPRGARASLDNSQGGAA